ncbi:DUF3617 domain-containing protein [Thiomicrorhabdus xiamenensis]|uniref:DUF3617 family protein n=1 Tax=Thiomicrorhabdus xiamenensis TaxID=2739063 RepID=A0A7D4SYT3_9GAMM|nr:DUF3617 family protein [Thiomicrorhabdus xiamenensis]QKI89344.1 DUF3617 family protein [Thiomicrorhabdus xiamenensis]
MKSSRALLILLSLLVSGCSADTSEINMEEGKWKIQTTVEMEGMPMMIPPVTVEQCITEEDMVPAQKNRDGSECEMMEYDINGNTVTWQFKCNDSSGSGEITYNGKSMDGKMTTTAAGMKMNSTIKGTYIGPCD